MLQGNYDFHKQNAESVAEIARSNQRNLLNIDTASEHVCTDQHATLPQRCVIVFWPSFFVLRPSLVTRSGP